MQFINILCLGLIVLSSAAIAYQDFKTRLISVLPLACFGIANIIQFLLTNSIFSLVENTVACSIYFVLCFVVLHLYYFIKTNRFTKILDRRFGWGDVWVLLLTGSCLPLQEMIGFFTMSYMIALIVYFFFEGDNKTIPLAGIVSICFCVFTSYRNFTGF